MPAVSIVQAAQVNAMQPIVVTASRMAENPANVSADVTVITQEEIAASQASNVAEILRTQVGLNVSSSGGEGKATSVFIRGGNSGHTLVLIDGVRVGSATLGSFNWGNLSTSAIERIEIVRGPQSSLYGADAMGGVIQIFTRKGQKGLQTQVVAESGTYGTKLYGLGVRGGSENGFTYAFDAETFDTKGFSAASSGTEADPAKRTTLSTALSFVSGKMQADINVRTVDATTALDGFGPVDALNYNQNYKQTVSSIKVTDHVSDRFESSLQYSRSTDDAITTDPLVTWNNSDYKTTINQFSWQNNYELNDATVILGYDYHKDAGVSKSAKLDKAITQKALYVSIAAENKNMGWNVSARKDNNSTSDNKTTYKLGTIWHASQNFNLSGNYGTGFKAPSINDLFSPFGGNSNLKSESSKGWDIGATYLTQMDTLKSKFSIVWFSQKYTDLIVWKPIAPGSFSYSPKNVNQARSKGVELIADMSGEAGFVRANWTKLNATDTATGLWLARRAQQNGTLTLGTDVSDLHIEADMAWVGKRYSDPDNTKLMQAYKKTNVRLSYAFAETWKLKFRVENLFDKSYEEVAGYGVAGRSTYTGVTATF